MKYLHTMVRVSDLDASLRFYRDALGLRELSRREYPPGRVTLVFLAAPGDEAAQVELTYNGTGDQSVWADLTAVSMWGLPIDLAFECHPAMGYGSQEAADEVIRRARGIAREFAKVLVKRHPICTGDHPSTRVEP